MCDQPPHAWKLAAEPAFLLAGPTAKARCAGERNWKTLRIAQERPNCCTSLLPAARGLLSCDLRSRRTIGAFCGSAVAPSTGALTCSHMRTPAVGPVSAGAVGHAPATRP